MEPSPITIPNKTKKGADFDQAAFLSNYQESITNPDAFWGQQGKRLDWITPYTKVKNTSFEYGNVDIKWFEDGELNASYNCIDRHLPEKANQVAYYWEGDQEGTDRAITYQELHDQVALLANGLKKNGCTKRRSSRYLYAYDP